MAACADNPIRCPACGATAFRAGSDLRRSCDCWCGYEWHTCLPCRKKVPGRAPAGSGSASLCTCPKPKDDPEGDAHG